MKIWKRNAIVATVLVLICAGVYLNWDNTRQDVVDLTQTIQPEQLPDGTVLAMGENGSERAEAVSADLPAADYFAQIRLSRQETRDSAVELLQETIAYEDGNEEATTAAASLDNLVADALAESQIESMIIAKGYQDCVAYMGEDTISVAVSSEPEGLAQEDVALIFDIITTQTNYKLSNIRIIEVK